MISRRFIKKLPRIACALSGRAIDLRLSISWWSTEIMPQFAMKFSYALLSDETVRCIGRRNPNKPLHTHPTPWGIVFLHQGGLGQPIDQNCKRSVESSRIQLRIIGRSRGILA